MHQFKDKQLESKILTHPSFEKNEEFQRLEFLGDKILAYEMAKILYESNLNEGEMSTAMSELVKKETLAYIATNLIEKYSFELLYKGDLTDSIKADFLEAWIGGLYLEEANIETIISELWGDLLGAEYKKNPKNILQETLQKQGKTPLYSYIKIGTNFKCILNVNGQTLTTKDAHTSKRKASENAASLYLERLSKNAEQDQSRVTSQKRSKGSFVPISANVELSDIDSTFLNGENALFSGDWLKDDKPPRSNPKSESNRKSFSSFESRPRENSKLRQRHMDTNSEDHSDVDLSSQKFRRGSDRQDGDRGSRSSSHGARFGGQRPSGGSRFGSSNGGSRFGGRSDDRRSGGNSRGSSRFGGSRSGFGGDSRSGERAGGAEGSTEVQSGERSFDRKEGRSFGSRFGGQRSNNGSRFGSSNGRSRFGRSSGNGGEGASSSGASESSRFGGRNGANRSPSKSFSNGSSRFGSGRSGPRFGGRSNNGSGRASSRSNNNTRKENKNE